MKRIDENQLAARVASLKERMAEIECNQQNEGAMDTLGKYITPIGSAIKTGAQKFFGSTAGKVATGAAAGAGALAAGQALTAPGQSASPTGTTKPAANSDPATKALQDKLIAAGAKIKADGIMGPATTAAMKQFPQAAAGAPVAPAAPVTSMDDSDNVDNREFVPPTATAGTPPPPAVGTAPTKAQQPAKSPQGTFTQQGVPANESVGFQNDELSRIISLVHHR
jgi:peptidoglycan hydrolase-like protein with peptidoglycan-binding domain